LTTYEILRGDVRQKLPEVPSESVDLCICSPPYWGLRDYGVDGQLGAEPTMDAYLDNTLKWVNEVFRVLKPTGSFVLNLGGVYYGSWGGGYSKDRHAMRGDQENQPYGVLGLKNAARTARYYQAKQFLDVAAFAYCRIISETGFVCRNRGVWCKPNVPSPIRSRLKQSWESMDWYVKNPEDYYFDKRPWMQSRSVDSKARDGRARLGNRPQSGYDGEHRLKLNDLHAGPNYRHRPGREFTRSNEEQLRYMRARAKGEAPPPKEKFRETAFPNGSFHAYAEETIEHAWRIVPVGEKQKGFEVEGKQPQLHVAPYPEALIKPWVESLCPQGGAVLDPFLGSGTSMKVARDLSRSCIGIELNPDYAAYAEKRCGLNAIALLAGERGVPAKDTATSKKEEGVIIDYG
jgi:DNA modification methylase